MVCPCYSFDRDGDWRSVRLKKEIGDLGSIIHTWLLLFSIGCSLGLSMKKKTWTEKRTRKPYGTQRTIPEGRNRYGYRKREAEKKHGRNFTPLLVGIDMPLPSPLEGGSWLLFFNSFVYSLFIEKEVQTPTSGFI